VSTAGGILVIDSPGAIFAALRSARLGIALWRSTGKARAVDPNGFALAIVAAYEQPDWHAIGQLVERIPTIIVAAEPDDEQAARAVSMGAFGYIPATLSADAMRRAVLGATEGEPAYSRRLLAQRLRALTRPQYSGRALKLTPRQREVVTLIAQGAADKEIAGALGITTATAQKHVTNLLKRWKLACPPSPFDLVFPSRRGTVQGHANILKRHFKPLCREVGIVLRWHDLRHFAVSLWIEQGFSVKEVMTFAGHSSIQMTMDRYGHLFPSPDHQRVMAAVEQRLFTPVRNTDATS